MHQKWQSLSTSEKEAFKTEAKTFPPPPTISQLDEAQKEAMQKEILQEIAVKVWVNFDAVLCKSKHSFHCLTV